VGDSGEWGADTQDRHHGVPELDGGGGRFAMPHPEGRGPFLARFWTGFGWF